MILEYSLMTLDILHTFQNNKRSFVIKVEKITLNLNNIVLTIIEGIISIVQKMQVLV